MPFICPEVEDSGARIMVPSVQRTQAGMDTMGLLQNSSRKNRALKAYSVVSTGNIVKHFLHQKDPHGHLSPIII